MAAGTGTVLSRRVYPSTLFGYTAVEVIFQPSASYETPGDIVVPAQVGLTTFAGILAFPTFGVDAAHTAVAAADLKPGVSVTLAGTATAPKLQFWATSGTEVADTTNQSAFRVPIIFLGS